jgi:hypothetical protein
MQSMPYVLHPGRHEDRISPAAVDALVDHFRKARFFTLRGKYEAAITDNPTYVLTIRTGNGTKQVIDYAGEQAGMPKIVTDLENAVDKAAGTERWIRGANGLVGWLAAKHFDFKSKPAAELVIYGLEEADDATLVDLVDRGVPLEMAFPNKDGKPVGYYLMDGAVRYGRTDLFRKLVGLGWLPRLGIAEASRAFADRAAACNATFVDAAADAGIDIDAIKVRPAERPNDDDEFAGYGETALAGLAQSYDCKNEVARMATAKRLLARGADPNRRDESGETAIFEVENVELLNLLLSHGADPRVVDKEGNSAVFGSWTDEIVLRLLQAGASAKGQYYDGLTLRQQMKERPMPKVKAWLANNPGIVPDR